MRRVAMIQNGVVVNLAVAPADDSWPHDGFEIIEIEPSQFVGIGWLWDGLSFSAPLASVIEPEDSLIEE